MARSFNGSARASISTLHCRAYLKHPVFPLPQTVPWYWWPGKLYKNSFARSMVPPPPNVFSPCHSGLCRFRTRSACPAAEKTKYDAAFCRRSLFSKMESPAALISQHSTNLPPPCQRRARGHWWRKCRSSRAWICGPPVVVSKIRTQAKKLGIV